LALERNKLGKLFAHFTCFFKQLKNTILTHSQLKGRQVQTDMRNCIHRYQGIKLCHTRRSHPGYAFGGCDTLQWVHNYMAANPPPLPLIEVSFILPTKAKYFSRFFLTVIVIYYMYHTNQGGNTVYN